MSKLLIVDDERNVLYSLVRGLRSPDLEILTAETAQEGLRLVEDERPDAVLLDVKLPDRSGLDVFVDMHRIEKRLPVIIMTAHTTTETAIEAMKRGAFDYLLKPFDLGELKRVLAKALEVSRLSRVPAVFDQNASGEEDADVDRIVGTSPLMQSVYKEIGRVAPQDVNVLILGESGTGKELVAGRSIITASGPIVPFSPSTALPFPKRSSKANCSVTNRERLPGPTGDASASSNRRMAERSSSTRSATWRRRRRRRC